MARRVFLLAVLTCVFTGTNAVLEFDEKSLAALFKKLNFLPESTPVGRVIGSISCKDSNQTIPLGISISVSRLVLDIGLTQENSAFTGVVLKNLQDFEKAGDQNNRDVEFTCTKDGVKVVKKTYLYIADVNDNEPIFVRQGGASDTYNVEIPEIIEISAQGGVEIFNQITVTDADGVNNVNVEALCVNVSTVPPNMGVTCDQVFRLEANRVSGSIYPAVYIVSLFALRENYEAFQSFTLSVLARNVPANTTTDPILNSTSQNVLVRIREVQNEPPSINENRLRIEMFENQPISLPVDFNHYIEAFDQDLRDPNPIDFELFQRDDAEQDGYDFFRLGEVIPPTDATDRMYRVQLYVNSLVNREAIIDSAKNLYVGIRAFETNLLGLPNRNPMNSTAIITVNVKDVNDEIPTFFSDEYSVAITEEFGTPSNGTTQLVPFGGPIYVSDADGVEFNLYNMRILPGPYSQYFSLDSYEGRSTTIFTMYVENQVLDYELGVDEMTVILQAEDANNPQFTSTALVTLTIIPLNDFRPEFDRPFYSFSVTETRPEDEPINIFVGKVTASDLDLGPAGQIKGYSIRDPSNTFTIDDNGNIFLVAPVDFETITSYAFSVEAEDNDPDNPQVATVQVSIAVQNIIDAPPSIIGEYVATVFETSTDLQPSITVQAINIEQLTNITFSIVGVQPQTINVNEYFSIDSVTGDFSLNKELNFAFTDKGLIRVLVRASATSTLFSEKYVNITVQNQNNHPPVFVPVRPDGTYNTFVSELAKPNDVAFKLNTTDADEENTPASEVRFQIQSGGDNDFIIEENSGIIRVSQEATLDADDQIVYTIVVKATDNGSPILSSSATVIVTIENKNNKAPVFVRPLYQFRVNESASVGEIIGQVSATDPDLNPNIKYGLDFTNTRIEKNNRLAIEVINLEDKIFMEEVSGIIRVAGTLNWQRYDRILINATAEDLAAEEGSPAQTSSASVVINILAIQDPSIVFEAPWAKDRPFYDVLTPENDNNTGEAIFKLQAIDPVDSLRIENYRKVVVSDPSDYFDVINSNIVLKKPLDFEVLEYGSNNQKILSVEVEAISADQLRTSTATVYFQVTDVNDNEPVFAPGPYIASVRESAVYATKVATISVTDRDSSSFGLSRFSLEGDDSVNDFFIQNVVGQRNTAVVLVAINASLDYETNPTYNLLVVATDNNGALDGNRVLQNLRIDVEDDNDNAPKFREDVYRFNVISTADIRTVVGRILADDPDTGTGGRIRYTLIDPVTKTQSFYFSVENEEISTATVGSTLQIGSIIVARSLEDLDDKEVVELVAVATDRGTPSLSSNTTVLITVSRGVIDPKPKWRTGLPSTVEIPENQAADFPVAEITVVRVKDVTIKYSFLTADGTGIIPEFSINEDTGEIRTRIPLDYESTRRYSLLILATDANNASLTNQYLLRVNVLDLDDNDPTFQRCTDRTYSIPVYARLREALPPYQFVYQVEACDDDDAPNNNVAYRPYAPPPTEEFRALCPDQDTFGTVFELDELSGIIRTLIPLDREMVNTYLLCVQTIKRSDLRKKRGVANRLLAGTLHDVLFIRITVDDANDNGPLFIDPVVRKVILIYPSIDISVAEATDPDLPPNSDIRYVIETIEFYKNGRKYRAPAAFTIDANDGKIYGSQSSYQEYDGGYFRIVVKAQDYKGENNLTDTQLQMVFVSNPSNRIRVVINKPADDIVAEDVNEMIERLNNLQDGVFYEVDKISYHVVGSQENLASDRTDVCILVVRDNTVQTARDATVFLEEQASVQRILAEYGATEPGPCDPAKSVYPQGWESYWWVLVAFAIFIFICVLILIFIILSLYSGYKRYMDTRRTYLVPGN